MITISDIHLNSNTSIPNNPTENGQFLFKIETDVPSGKNYCYLSVNVIADYTDSALLEEEIETVQDGSFRLEVKTVFRIENPMGIGVLARDERANVTRALLAYTAIAHCRGLYWAWINDRARESMFLSLIPTEKIVQILTTGSPDYDGYYKSELPS